MARSLVDVQDVADAYKKDGHKVSVVNIDKPGHYSFKRTSPDGRTFVHKFSPTGSKLETGPAESPRGVDAADDDGVRSGAAPVKRGRGRPRGSLSGAR